MSKNVREITRQQVIIERRLKLFFRLTGRSEYDLSVILTVLRKPESVPKLHIDAPIYKNERKVRKPWTPEETEIVNSWIGSRTALAKFLNRPLSTINRHLPK